MLAGSWTACSAELEYLFAKYAAPALADQPGTVKRCPDVASTARVPASPRLQNVTSHCTQRGEEWPCRNLHKSPSLLPTSPPMDQQMGQVGGSPRRPRRPKLAAARQT